MIYLLSQTPPPDPADTQLGYDLLVFIMAVGVAGMLLLLGLMMIRRLARRWSRTIEKDIADRRANPTPTTDLWRESADRYTDPDALSAEERQARETGSAGEQEEPDPFADPTFTATDPQDEPEPEDDPFGLFRDKPYQEPDEDEEDDEDDDLTR